MPRGTLLLPVGVRLSSQDAKARATRTAMLIEYGHGKELSCTSTSDSKYDAKYDLVLSA